MNAYITLEMNAGVCDREAFLRFSASHLLRMTLSPTQFAAEESLQAEQFPSTTL